MSEPKAKLKASIARPNRSVTSAVLKLTAAARAASTTTLSLRETGALLTYIRTLTRLARGLE
jgi:hypothetical protein